MAGNLTSIDTIAGGDGTDTISVTAATLDAAFTKVTTVENLTIAGAAIGLTLGSIAQAAGVTTATFGAAGTVETITVGAGFTNALTVVANDPTKADVVAAAAYTGALTVKTAAATGLGATGTFTGGTGTTDTITYDLTAGAVTQAGSATITAFEKINTSGATTNALSVTLDNANVAAAAATLTIDGSALTTGVLTVAATAEADGKVVVLGGGAADLITVSASTLGDNLSGGEGGDTFTVTAFGNLTSLDTIAGGNGTDILSFSQATAVTLTDAMFTKITSVENIVIATSNSAHSVVLGTAAVAAGVVSVVNTATNTSAVTIDLTGMTGSAGVNVATNAGADTILGSFGNDTIVSGAGVDVVTGGAGGDKITITAGTGSTVRININADVATGATLASVDQVTGVTAGTDFIDLSGTTLMSTGGSIKALTLGNDSLNWLAATTATPFSNLALLANQSVQVFSLNTVDTVVGTTGLVANTLLNQAGIDEAVAYITGNIGTSGSVQNTNVFITVTDGTNTGIFQYQEGAVDAGIQAAELTLVGTLVGVNTMVTGAII
ncbi:MAG: hypothetical protein IPG23_05750 [Burkholderiales bacterium]|nr:hypothetical protein [Burkholderiales bacterium]